MEELEHILTDTETFEKFKDFDNHKSLFTMSKNEYISKMTDMIYMNYINKNVDKSFIFHRFVISLLGPMMKDDPTIVFKNKLLAHLSKKYTTYNAFIKGICGEKKDLNLIVKNDIADMLEKNEFELDYFFNFVDSTINDSSVFLRTKGINDLALDYVVYFKIAKIIIEKYPNHIELAVKIIGIEKVRELEIAAKIEISNIPSKNGTNNGTHSFFKGKHIIEISQKMVNTYKESLSKKDLAKILAVTYHEAQHTLQYEMYHSDIKNYKILLWAKEELARLSLGDKYYDENYSSYIYESDANYVGWKNTLKYFNEELECFSIDEFIKDNMRLYKTLRKTPLHKDVENLVGHGVVKHEAASLLNVIAATVISKKPDLLSKFPILNTEFNKNGTIKSIIDKLNDKRNCLEALELDRKEAYSNYFADLIKREDVLAKEIEINGLKFDLNRLYSFVLSRFVDNHIDALCADAKSIIAIEDDVTEVLINIVESIFENFYQEDIISKMSKIRQLLLDISTYILKKRNDLDKKHFLKIITYREWSDISVMLSRQFHYINSRLNYADEVVSVSVEKVLIRTN